MEACTVWRDSRRSVRSRNLMSEDLFVCSLFVRGPLCSSRRSDHVVPEHRASRFKPPLDKGSVDMHPCTCEAGSHVFPRGEVYTLVQAFISSVADPWNPKCCPWCFSILVYDIHLCSTVMDALKVDHQTFWDTCLLLLDAYTSGPLPRLRRALESNQLNCSDRATVHAHPIHGDVQDPFDIYILALDRAVRIALRRGTKPLLNPGHTMRGFDRPRRHWPTSLEQLFPRGVARGVDVLVHWCCTALSAQQFATLTAFVIVMPGHVVPRLVESPRREQLCWSFLQALYPAAFPWPGPAPFTMPRGVRSPPGVRGGDAAVNMVFVAMSTIMHVRLDAGDGGRVYDGYEALFLAVAEDFSSRVGPGDDCTPLMSLRGCVAFFRSRLGLQKRMAYPIDMRAAAKIILHHALARCALARACGNMACGATQSPGDAERKFQKCGRCKFVFYCSRECQKQDWREGVAHRSVCPLMGRVNAGVRTFANYDSFAADFAACDFDREELNLLYSWALSDCDNPPVPLSELASHLNQIL